MRPSIGRRPAQVIIALGLWISAFILGTPTRAQDVPTQVYVCTDVPPYYCYNGPGVLRYGPYPFENEYVATVLKNEWPRNSAYMQALYAGAVAIRTFAQRVADGCGAIAYYYNSIPVENNNSQRFFGTGVVEQYHRDAANRTAGLTILRFNDNAIACAKHFADTGDPTGSFPDGGSPTNTSVQDDVSHSYTGHNPGIGQNGSSAWTAGSLTYARLNWPQILGKYYTRIGLSTGTNNTGIPIPKNNFRWTWADVTTTIDFTGTNGQTYHSATAKTPTVMRPGCNYAVPFTIFNGSKVDFYANWGSPANPTRLSYHWWWDAGHTSWIVWDGYRSWGTDIGWGTQRTITGWVTPPQGVPLYRTYYLTWDLVQEGVAWFYDKGATRQDVAVFVYDTAPCS